MTQIKANVENNIFDNLIINNEILRSQNVPIAPSKISAEAIFKQLWSK